MLLHQTKVLQPFLILLLLKTMVMKPVCRLHTQTKTNTQDHNDIQGCLTADVSSRYNTEVKEGNKRKMQEAPLFWISFLNSQSGCRSCSAVQTDLIFLYCHSMLFKKLDRGKKILCEQYGYLCLCRCY